MNNNQRPGGQPRQGNNGYPQGQNRPAGRNGYTQNNTPRNGVPGNNNQQNNIPRGNPQRNNPAQNGARGTYNNNQRQGNPNGRTANSRPANNRPGNAPRNYRAPAKRSAEPQKIKLTAEQIEINRVQRQRERYYAKKRRASAIRTFISRFMIYLVLVVILSGITAMMFFYNLVKVSGSDESGYAYEIGGNRSTLKYVDAVRDGRIYVCFSDIADLCGLAVIGDVDDIKYVIKNDEAETIRFLTGSRVAYVNTVETRLGADSYYKDGKVYVPVDFVKTYFKGLNISVDSRKHTVTVDRVITNLGDDGKLPKNTEAEYADLYFLLQYPSTLDHIDEDEAAAAVPMPELGFLTDLSGYEQYLNPGNTPEYLTLVNVTHNLDSTYVPPDLTSVVNTRNDGRQTQQMRLYAEKALEAMFIELKAAGYEDVSVTSGYRSYATQEYNFNNRKQQYIAGGMSEADAYATTATIINPPGSSEHQSGLCADLHNLPAADIAFANEAAYTWLKENCWKFGFILRYPEDKVSITGISFEPWHYRYVGRFHAQQMQTLGMCLEEYWTYLGNS